MKHMLFCAAGLLAVTPANAADEVYRCLAETVHHWTGDSFGDVESVPPGDYEIALDVAADTDPDDGTHWAEMVTTGERYELEVQMGDPSELVARREDNRFSLRIDLDATPMRFAGIGETTLLTGTCFLEPRTTK
jgi:hypothetical protein